MRTIKHTLIGLAIVGVVLGIYFALKSEYALVMHPQGMIARSELKLIATIIGLMLIIIVPTYFFLFFTVWRQRKKKAAEPEGHGEGRKELILWIIPSVVVAVMIAVTWKATHELDPYRPIASDVKPLTIQVVAIDWKWLFLYPEQKIATLNYVQFPAATPIRFELAADGSPMNSFWIPQLSGQIYAMTGMMTLLHMMADRPGIFMGRAAEINGDGFADMTFIAEATPQADFDQWVADVKASPLQLTESTYNELLKPSINDPVTLYSDFENDLFMKLMMKHMHPGGRSSQTGINLIQEDFR